MKYVGLQTQIWRNNRNTVILLCMFPVILLGMVLLAIMTLDFFGWFCWDGACPPGPQAATFHWPIIWYYFKDAMPFTLCMTGLWFIIAYCTNTAIIRHITHAKPTERKDNLRVYNLVENLCIAGGIEMPQINIVQDDQLNAFASGVDVPSFTITLTTGLIDKLDDAELAAVIGHELTHIKNRDTRLMVVCIVFVGIFAAIRSMAVRMLMGLLTGPRRRTTNRSKKNGGGGGAIFGIILFLVALIVWSTVGYFFSWLTRMAISRTREYVADAGGAELCGDPLALASALQKISDNPGLDNVHRSDVAQLYIIHPDEEFDNDMKLSGWVAKANTMFCTHPDTPERIKILKQF
ncbi:MAG: M48 family metallopeptidase [Fibrobacter sp.]|nr:M48 family metallopeptidase [Fibrobacter sp.]